MIAPVTPFKANGEVNYSKIEKLAHVLVSRGADALYLCGGTGEGLTMSPEERMHLVESWKDALPEQFPYIVHVGSTSLTESRRLAAHAIKVGAAGVSSIAPPFPAAKDLASLTEHFRLIAAAAPELPFYYYHNSEGPGPKIRARDFLDYASSRIPNLAGLKFTHEDLMDLSQCLRFQNGRYDVFYGRDQMLIGALATGACCAVGGTYNVLSPLVGKIMHAFAAGNIVEARKWNDTLVDAVAVFGKAGGLSAVKSAMTFLGVDCGAMQSPARTLTSDEAQRLGHSLRAVWPDIFEVPASDSVFAIPAVNKTKTAVTANSFA